MNVHPSPGVIDTMPARTSYDVVSRVYHWIIALSMIAMVCVGLNLQFGGLGREEAATLRDIH